MPNFKARTGERIAHFRERAGISQRDAANKFEPPIASSTIARIESGISWPEYSKLEVFAKLYGCAVDDFFVVAAEPHPPTPTRSALIGDIVLALADLDETKLTGLLNLARSASLAVESKDLKRKRS